MDWITDSLDYFNKQTIQYDYIIFQNYATKSNQWGFLTPPFIWLLKKLSLGHRDAARTRACRPALRPRPGRSGLGTPEGGASCSGWMVGVGFSNPEINWKLYPFNGHQLVMGTLGSHHDILSRLQNWSCQLLIFFVFFLEEGVIIIII